MPAMVEAHRACDARAGCPRRRRRATTWTSTAKGGVPVVTRGSWLTLIAMTGSLSMIMLDQTVVSVALPDDDAANCRSASTGAQWVVNAYVLAMAAAVALGGKLGVQARAGHDLPPRCPGVPPRLRRLRAGTQQRHDDRRPGRAGLGAALMMPVTASIVMAAFPATIRGRAMGAYVGISQIFLALGPLVGGTFTEWWTWRAVFWINVPVGLAALLLGRRRRAGQPHPARAADQRRRRPSMLMAGIGGKGLRPAAVLVLALGLGPHHQRARHRRLASSRCSSGCSCAIPTRWSTYGCSATARSWVTRWCCSRPSSACSR